jgi:hypothetical protein
MESEEHLDMLERLGSAEGVFYLGVSAMRRGDFPTAVVWMEKAHALNPQHEDTKRQLDHLRHAVAAVDQSK